LGIPLEKNAKSARGFIAQFHHSSSAAWKKPGRNRALGESTTWKVVPPTFLVLIIAWLVTAGLLLLLLAGIARSTALLILTRALRLVTLLLLIALLLAILLSGLI
jgi:hypothetical protein